MVKKKKQIYAQKTAKNVRNNAHMVAQRISRDITPDQNALKDPQYDWWHDPPKRKKNGNEIENVAILISSGILLFLTRCLARLLYEKKRGMEKIGSSVKIRGREATQRNEQ